MQSVSYRDETVRMMPAPIHPDHLAVRRAGRKCYVGQGQKKCGNFHGATGRTGVRPFVIDLDPATDDVNTTRMLSQMHIEADLESATAQRAGVFAKVIGLIDVSLCAKRPVARPRKSVNLSRVALTGARVGTGFSERIDEECRSRFTQEGSLRQV